MVPATAPATMCCRKVGGRRPEDEGSDALQAADRGHRGGGPHGVSDDPDGVEECPAAAARAWIPLPPCNRAQLAATDCGLSTPPSLAVVKGLPLVD